MPTKAAPLAAAAAAHAGPKTPSTAATVAANKDERLDEPAGGAAQDEPSTRTGTFSFTDGAKYQGEYVGQGGRMVRHGVGTFVNGPERYEGDWESDQMHGKGAYQFASGCRYEGEFAHNLFHGAGVYQSTDGATYSGQWQFSRMHGDGAYVDKDGVEWRGRFFNGKYDNGRVFHTLR